MEYVNLKESHLFQVRICTDREALIKALAGEEMEILLIAAEWYESCQALIHQKCTVILSEGSLVKEAEGCHAVYKYQWKIFSGSLCIIIPSRIPRGCISRKAGRITG